MFCSKDHIRDTAKTKIKIKIIKQYCTKLIKFICLFTMTKNTNPKIDAVWYQIHMNLLVNDIKHFRCV